MKNSILILIALFILAKISFAYDSTTAKYMPLQIGNTWVYYGSTLHPYSSSSWKCRQTITGTTTVSGKVYFQTQVTVVQISGTESGGVQYLQNIRLDSNSMVLYNLGNGCGKTEILLDSLLARFHDSATVCSTDQLSICSDTNSVNLFGSLRQKRTFVNYRWNTGRVYVKNLGLTNHYWGEAQNSLDLYLLGCVINGTLFGDTNMLVGVQNFGNEIPNEFSLSQNYPNPFNPKTVIKFQVAGDKFVKLVVYDALGHEVTTLVNQQLSPGTYQTDWDASNYPSGVYFYQLTANDELIATKKMVLIK